MQLTFAAPGQVVSGAWIVGALEGSQLTAAAAKADKASGGAITRGLAVSRFTGKRGQLLEVLAPAGVAASRIVLVGLGKASEFDGHAAEDVAAAASSGAAERRRRDRGDLRDRRAQGLQAEARRTRRASGAGRAAEELRLQSLPHQGPRRIRDQAEEGHDRDDGRVRREEGVGAARSGGERHVPRPRSGQRAAECSLPRRIREALARRSPSSA